MSEDTDKYQKFFDNIFLQTDVETQRQILSIDNTTSVNYDSELFRLFENFLETVYNEKKDKKKCGIRINKYCIEEYLCGVTLFLVNLKAFLIKYPDVNDQNSKISGIQKTLFLPETIQNYVAYMNVVKHSVNEQVSKLFENVSNFARNMRWGFSSKSIPKSLEEVKEVKEEPEFTDSGIYTDIIKNYENAIHETINWQDEYTKELLEIISDVDETKITNKYNFNHCSELKVILISIAHQMVNDAKTKVNDQQPQQQREEEVVGEKQEEEKEEKEEKEGEVVVEEVVEEEEKKKKKKKKFGKKIRQKHL